MSFADELRSAPENEEKRQQMQLEQDIKSFIGLWYKFLKGKCLVAAQGGINEVHSDLFDDMETLKYACRNSSYYRFANGEKLPMTYDDEKMLIRLVQKRLIPKEDYFYLEFLDSEIEMIISEITRRLKADGLDVKTKVVKGRTKDDRKQIHNVNKLGIVLTW